MLVRCLYASRPAKPITSALSDEILRQSRANNPTRGITGLLCFTADVFVQVIEGGRDEVSKLFNTIIRDDRNKDVCLLVYEEISERHFGSWTMGEVKLEGINPSVLLKYYEKSEINPFEAPGQATMSMLMELVASGAIVSRVNFQSLPDVILDNCINSPDDSILAVFEKARS